MTAILLQLPTQPTTAEIPLPYGTGSPALDSWLFFFALSGAIFAVLYATWALTNWLLDRFVAKPLTTQPKRLELERRHLDVIVMGKR